MGPSRGVTVEARRHSADAATVRGYSAKDAGLRIFASRFELRECDRHVRNWRSKFSVEYRKDEPRTGERDEDQSRNFSHAQPTAHHRGSGSGRTGTTRGAGANGGERRLP